MTGLEAASEQPFGDARRLLQQMGQTPGRGHLFLGLEDGSRPATPPQAAAHSTSAHSVRPGPGAEAVPGAAEAMLRHSGVPTLQAQVLPLVWRACLP